jgi:hypothetical protein
LTLTPTPPALNPAKTTRDASRNVGTIRWIAAVTFA